MVTVYLKSFNRSKHNTESRLWKDLPLNFVNVMFLLQRPSLSLTHNELHQAHLSIPLWAFHPEIKSHFFKNSYPDTSDPPIFLKLNYNLAVPLLPSHSGLSGNRTYISIVHSFGKLLYL